MKENAKLNVISAGICVLNGIYCLYKLLPVQKKITILSKQEDVPSEDIRLLTEALRLQTDAKIKVYCKTIGKGLGGKAKYLAHMLTCQMYALATSRVIVLDGYCILASNLKKRKGTTIFQMWHAMGFFKEFGYQVCDKAEGYSAGIISTMHMHKNYDHIFISSDACRRNMLQAFGYEKDIAIVAPLPRTDTITQFVRIAAARHKVYGKYPELGEKETVLYAPTFRLNLDMEKLIEDLISAADYEKYNLVIKLHPKMSQTIVSDKAIISEGLTFTELLDAADYVITDYSSVVFEAAVAHKPVIRYVPDYDEYTKERGLGCSDSEMPVYKAASAEDAFNAIGKKKYDIAAMDAFGRKYVDIKEDNAGYMAGQIVKRGGL